MTLQQARRPRSAFMLYALLAVCLLLCLAAAACKKDAEHTADPQLKGIDTLLNAQLPAGTPLTRVTYFLNSRGYEIHDESSPHIVVAIVRHVNTETLQPEAARVTFHFDAQDKLVSYDLEPAPAQAMH